jgi:hypothetical protein
MLLVLASVSGGLWFAYAYVTDSAAMAGRIRTEAPRFFPGSALDVGGVRIRPFTGEISISHLSLRQPIDGTPFLAAKLPWLQIKHDARAMLKGRFVPHEVVVAQPTLRLRRRKDGSWNLQGLLADPWPGPQMKTPPILIQNGTVELVESDTNSVAVLREVAIKVESVAPRVYQFEGSARGDSFDRVRLQGTFDAATGQVVFRGDVTRLALSDTFYGRLPVEFRDRVKRLGLTSGEVDISLARVIYNPNTQPRVRYDASAQLRGGVWNCPKLPFPLNDLAASLVVRDGVLTIEDAVGYNGTTTARIKRGTFTLGDPDRAPFDLLLHVIDLELDPRLRARTPAKYAELWNIYQPRGRVSVSVQAVREHEDGPVGYGMRVDCRDVAMLFRDFKYPLDHIQGSLVFERQQVKIDLWTLVGNKPLRATGTIENPGRDAHVHLNFVGEALPIDKTLFDAMPPDVRKVVDEFHPTGTVRGRAHVERLAPPRPDADPRGIVKIDAQLELNERCSIRWDGLPYPVENLTGQLEIYPNRWKFKNMRGSNGQAVITGYGEVEKLPIPWTGPGDPLKVDLHLNAEKLPFDDQLRDALPPAWRKSWATINPIGSSDVEAKIQLEPGKPDLYHLVIDPGPSTGIHLKFSPVPQPGVEPGTIFDLRMEDVKGRFFFDNGTVTMHDAGFLFYGAHVEFATGTVVVEDNGRFRLGVKDLRVPDFRLDSRLRAKMPPVMAQFARRLGDGQTFRFGGNLRLGWSGLANDPVRCEWDNVTVILNRITIQAGLPLEHLQGQLDSVWGHSNGENLEVHGALRLESISLLGQQVTALESPIHVKGGMAELSDIRGALLGGQLTGRIQLSLDEAPHYAASIVVERANLENYARSLPGRQSFRGLVFGRLAFNGFGNDLHTLQGQGEAHIVQGDLGELPGVLPLLKFLKLSPATKTAFDSADVSITIRDGKSRLAPIQFIGDALSLQGQGTLDAQGDLDLRLRVVYGRDTRRFRMVSDVLREASGQFLIVHVLGTPAFPKFSLEPLPVVIDRAKSLGQLRTEPAGRP